MDALIQKEFKDNEKFYYISQALEQYYSKGFIDKDLTILSIKQIIEKDKNFDKKYTSRNKYFWYKLSTNNQKIKPIFSKFKNFSNLLFVVKKLFKITFFELIENIKKNKSCINDENFDILTIIRSIKKSMKPQYSLVDFQNIILQVNKSKYEKKTKDNKKKKAKAMYNNNYTTYKSRTIASEFWFYKPNALTVKLLNSVQRFNHQEIEHFSLVDNMIRNLIPSYSKVWKTGTDKFIYQKISYLLSQCSFDLPKCYCYLKLLEKNKDKCADGCIQMKYLFTSVDDYIIINMQNTDLYKELIYLKGESAVLKRKKYLNIK